MLQKFAMVKYGVFVAKICKHALCASTVRDIWWSPLARQLLPPWWHHTHNTLVGAKLKSYFHWEWKWIPSICWVKLWFSLFVNFIKNKTSWILNGLTLDNAVENDFQHVNIMIHGFSKVASVQSWPHKCEPPFQPQQNPQASSGKEGLRGGAWKRSASSIFFSCPKFNFSLPKVHIQERKRSKKGHIKIFTWTGFLL